VTTSRPLTVVPDVAGVPAKLSLRGVDKSFRSASGDVVRAITDVTLDVDAGEFLCLIGPSGCGKSAILNLLAGLESPDAGEVLLDGRPVEGPGPDRALLFQEPALFPWMSLRANVEFGLRMLGLPAPEVQQRAEEWLARIELSEFADAQPHELSRGMRQRAALARALVCRPDVLLADEPFGSLDAQAREILQQELQSLWTELGNTLVFVTHNVREAALLADRVVVLSARPGTPIEEHRITSPRPRHLEDALLSRVVVDIHEHLVKEVERAAREEAARTDLA
jgi:NitT/TauT family transport system ATP-binding protein